MKEVESGREVLPGLGAGEDPGSRVLHILEPVQGFGREPRQDSITGFLAIKVIKAWMRVSSTSSEREGWSLDF